MARYLEHWRGGAFVGLVVGTAIGIAGSANSQWWLLLSIPVGVLVGSAVEAPIQPRRRIPLRTILKAALLADFLGAYAVAAVLVATDPHLGASIAGDGPIADTVGFGTTALAYAGIWMLFVTGPSAVAGSVALRYLRSRQTLWGAA
jgi:hypothetical protein